MNRRVATAAALTSKQEETPSKEENAPEGFPQTSGLQDFGGMMKSMNKGLANTTTITSEETPPGLQILAHLDKIGVMQQPEMLELMMSFETENKYNIVNLEKNQQILYAQEFSEIWDRQCYGPRRAFDMSFYNIRNEEILHLHRFYRCEECCYFCCLQKMEVYAPAGKLLGTIKQKWACCKPNLVVKDNQGKSLFKIKGPCCLFGTVDFPVTSAKDGTEIGVIEKKWGGWGVEALTDMDVFEMEFKQPLSVEVKYNINKTLLIF